jgi:hypothetical protein
LRLKMKKLTRSRPGCPACGSAISPRVSPIGMSKWAASSRRVQRASSGSMAATGCGCPLGFRQPPEGVVDDPELPLQGVHVPPVEPAASRHRPALLQVAVPPRVSYAVGAPAGDAGGLPVRVALFVTCLVDGLFPDVGKATFALLEWLGHPGGKADDRGPSGEASRCLRLHRQAAKGNRRRPALHQGREARYPLPTRGRRGLATPKGRLGELHDDPRGVEGVATVGVTSAYLPARLKLDSGDGQTYHRPLPVQGPALPLV